MGRILKQHGNSSFQEVASFTNEIKDWLDAIQSGWGTHFPTETPSEPFTLIMPAKGDNYDSLIEWQLVGIPQDELVFITIAPKLSSIHSYNDGFPREALGNYPSIATELH
ncbi:MAG TPA: hypothetical protein PLV25_08095, partial [Opitutales bacterium]|nr:hypothetical protein [Opitutales bacterium]